MSDASENYREMEGFDSKLLYTLELFEYIFKMKTKESL
jgi:hypothetical protein